MKRNEFLFIVDILNAIDLIERSSKDLSQRTFESDVDIVDATIRRLEVIGEAVKNLPLSLRDKYPEVHWKGVAGFRDVLTHGYFKIDLNLVWKIIKDDLPVLKKQILQIKNNLKQNQLGKKTQAHENAHGNARDFCNVQ